MTRGEKRLREALRKADVPDEGEAEERGWRVVRSTFAERDPQPRRARLRTRAALALAGAGLVAALALTPAGADVRKWIADAIDAGEENARPTLGTLPAPGSILVTTRDEAWIVRDDGLRRRLGHFSRATWSPNALFVAAAEGKDLFALSPEGELRWRLTAPRPIRALDWSQDEGFRIAYVAGEQLRVVAGDGTDDTEVLSSVGAPVLAWQPESSPAAVHRLAYVDADNRVSLIDTDSGRVLWRTVPVLAGVEGIQWSDDGERLLVRAEGFALLFDRRGNPIFKGPAASGADQVALSPDGSELAVARSARNGGAELALVPVSSPLERKRERVLYRTAPGTGQVRFGRPTFSPNGEWILLPWRQADQWLFVRTTSGRVNAVADISRQLGAERRDAVPLNIAGWCC